MKGTRCRSSWSSGQSVPCDSCHSPALGEFTRGTDLLRSESLALVQLLVLYQLVWARATVATGGAPPRIEVGLATGADSALHA